MVLLHVKRGDDEAKQFLVEVAAATPCAELTQQLAEIHNLRLKVGRLTAAAEGLARHGPMKPPEQQGLDDETPMLEDVTDEGDIKKRVPEHGPHYCQDPTERRTGNAPPSDMGAIISRTVEDAARLVSKDQIAMKQLTSRKALLDSIDAIKGATMIVYPMGLPPFDTVRQILDEKEELGGSAAGLEVLDPEVASVWWASKELARDKLLSDFVGKNEKTKIVCKLQKKGAGAPQREPVVSKEEQQAMVSFYHKKQQESKVLEANNEDDFANSAWANPKALKNAFTGIGDVSWRPGR
ncbi:hypothetical protein T492DRAFT_912376 [Pavlovales sp. CCMP2436]|nr:hypothetical protein T492DRAFT_912376 [Pavlovales sp. CCMP2436]|mmetsp:Transcript_40100/g.92918  ORF Transcript_40100/g.92918 Transcript_40100/m.92918 type:complete len:295 (-) Transcript_40100:249-1133(-)